MKILFVCTGNTCRSPIAEGLLKSAAGKDIQIGGKVEVSSAGIFAEDGEPPSENAVRVLKEGWGIDISAHKAKTINPSDLAEADLVLTMTRSHRDSLLSVFPEYSSKIFALKEYLYNKDTGTAGVQKGKILDISDPYGMPAEVYERCAEEIEKVLEMLLKVLKEEIAKS